MPLRFVRTLLLRVTALVCVGLSGMVAAPSAPAPAPRVTLHIGLLGVGSLLDDPQPARSLEQYLEGRLGDVDVSVATYDYQHLERAVLVRSVDMVVTSPSDYLTFAHRLGLSPPLATLVFAHDDQPLEGIGGVILVRANRADLRRPADLRGRRIGIVDRRSLGGFQAQAYELLRQGVNVQRDATLVPTELPEANALRALLDGRVDAIFARSGAWEGWIADGRVTAGQLRPLALRDLPGYPFAVSTALYPHGPLAALPQLEVDLAKRTLAALLDLPHDSAPARGMSIYGFTLPADYDAVRDVVRALRVPPFDGEERVSFAKIWEDHRGWLLALAASTALVFALLVWSMVGRRRLRASEERFRQLFEQSRQAVMLLKDGHLVAMNRSALDLLGVADAADVRGRTPLDFSPPVQPDGKPSDQAATDAIAVAAQKGTHEFIWRHRHTDGHEFDVHSVLTMVEVGGEQLLHCVARDITAEQRAQAELDEHRRHLEELVARRTAALEAANDALREAKEMAEAASVAKSTFLANMSHEIRTPMNAILGFSQLLEHEIEAPDQRRKLERVAQSARHLLGIIDDILDLSKIEAGRLPIADGEVDVVQTVDEAREMLALRAAAKGLRLAVHVDPGFAGLRLRGDAMRIRQILVNFVGNAIKFTDHGGVSIHATLNDVTSTDVGLRIEVRDTGIGISPDEQARLFQPFEQVQNSNTREYGGSGLGLVISRRLAQLMGGACSLESAPGRGSAFWFTARLQRACAGAPVVAPATRSVELRKGARLLLAEDNEVNQAVATAMLERIGLQVDVAVNGAEAVEKFARSAFDLVLMDLQMPVLDGLDATRRIRALAHGRVVPIIAMTASAFAEDRARCIEAGMNGHVAKPVDMRRLREALAEWLPATVSPR